MGDHAGIHGCCSHFFLFRFLTGLLKGRLGGHVGIYFIFRIFRLRAGLEHLVVWGFIFRFSEQQPFPFRFFSSLKGRLGALVVWGFIFRFSDQPLI